MLHKIAKKWKQPIVLYLGDHDPSGINISRVARKKIQRFSGKQLEWKRVAVTSAQFDQMKGQFGIPTKRGDPLSPTYEANHDNLCVEVDAIPSDEIRSRLDKAIQKRVDMQIWQQTQAKEQKEQQQIKKLVSRFKSCIERLGFFVAFISAPNNTLFCYVTEYTRMGAIRHFPRPNPRFWISSPEAEGKP